MNAVLLNVFRPSGTFHLFRSQKHNRASRPTKDEVKWQIVINLEKQQLVAVVFREAREATSRFYCSFFG